MIILSSSAHGVDFDKHYRAYELIRKGENPYLGKNYLLLNYPVFSIWLFSWLSLFEFHTAERLWDVWNIVLIGLSAIIVAYFFTPPGRCNEFSRSSDTRNVGTFSQLICNQWRVWGAFLLLFYLPPIVRMYDGNVEPTMLFFLILFGAALFNGRDFLAGVFLAFSVMVKVMSIFVLPCFIIMRRTTVLKGFALTVVVYALLLLVTGHWQWEWTFISSVLPNASYHWQSVSASLVCFWADYIFPPAKTNPQLFRLLSVVNNGVLLIFTIIFLVTARRKNKDFYTALGFNFLLLPLLSPLLEYHHHTWEVIAYFVFWRAWLSGKLRGVFFYAQFFFWLLLIAMGYCVDLGFRSYYPATFSALALFLINAYLLTCPKYLSAEENQKPEIVF